MKAYIYPLVIAVALLSGGCFLFDQSEDEPLGSVHVEALLVADTCGPGVTSGDPTMSYEVDLRRSGDTLHWSSPGEAYQGTFSSDDEFCIVLNAEWHVRDPDPWYDDPGCSMVRQERLCGEVAFSQSETDASGAALQQVVNLTARHEAFISGNTGSDCSDQIGLAAGQFLSLPCQVAYTLTGSAIEE